jgi:hypothetical protein
MLSLRPPLALNMYGSSGRTRSRIPLQLGEFLATKIGLVVLWEVPHLILLVHTWVASARSTPAICCRRLERGTGNFPYARFGQHAVTYTALQQRDMAI